METDTMTFGSVITYILLMLFMMVAGTAIGQIEVVHFNANFNEASSCTWVKKLSDCDVSFVDILEDPDLPAEHQIVVVPTIIVFNNKPEDPIMKGGSCIISPLGKVQDSAINKTKTIIYADINLDETIKGKYDFDVVGHYSRPDIFKLEIDKKSKKPVV